MIIIKILNGDIGLLEKIILLSKSNSNYKLLIYLIFKMIVGSKQLLNYQIIILNKIYMCLDFIEYKDKNKMDNILLLKHKQLESQKLILELFCPIEKSNLIHYLENYLCHLYNLC